MSMPYDIKQQVVQEFFFQKRSNFTGKRQNWIFCFLRVGEAVSILKICRMF